METIVARQLGMEAGRQQPALACGDDCAIIESRERFYILSHGVDARGANKDRPEWCRSQCRDLQIGFKAIKLASESIAPGGDIHQIQCRLSFRTSVGNAFREQDHPGACPPERHLAPGTLPDRFKQAIGNEQLADRRTFAARNNQAVDTIEMLRKPYLSDLMSKAAERMLVLDKCPLQGKDTNIHKSSQASRPLPAARCQQFTFRNLANLNTDHCFAQSLTYLGNDLRILIMCCRRDDRLCALSGIAGFEDA